MHLNCKRVKPQSVPPPRLFTLAQGVQHGCDPPDARDEFAAQTGFPQRARPDFKNWLCL